MATGRYCVAGILAFVLIPFSASASAPQIAWAPATLPAGAAQATRGEALEFVGYLRVGGGLRFSLVERGTARTSGMIALGASFRGYTLKSFDPQAEVLTVVRGDTVRPLLLKQERALDGAPAAQRQLWFSIAADGALRCDREPIALAVVETMLRAALAGDDAVVMTVQQPRLPDAETRERVGRTMTELEGVVQRVLREMQDRNEPHAPFSSRTVGAPLRVETNDDARER